MSKSPPSKEALFDFLRSGTAMMKSDATRKLLADKAECPDPGKTLIELQRAGWDVLGVNRDAGCQALDEIQQGDTELFQMRQVFVQTAMRTFVETVQSQKPATLDWKGKIPRETIIRFFDTCNTKLDLPETMEMLVNWAKENKAAPGQLMIDMQKEVLEWVGFEREHGCRVLSQIPQDFPSDQELHQRLMQWKGKAEQTCMMVVKIANAHLKMASSNPNNEAAQQLGRAVPITEIIQQQLNADDDMKELAAKARKEIELMSGEAQEEHITVMQTKMEKMMQLPPGEREEAMRNNTDVDKYDVVKSQVIMLTRMEAKKSAEMEAGRPAVAKPSESASAGGGAAASSGGPKVSVPTTAAPGQMSM